MHVSPHFQCHCRNQITNKLVIHFEDDNPKRRIRIWHLKKINKIHMPKKKNKYSMCMRKLIISLKMTLSRVTPSPITDFNQFDMARKPWLQCKKNYFQNRWSSQKQNSETNQREASSQHQEPACGTWELTTSIAGSKQLEVAQEREQKSIWIPSAF